MREIKFRFFDTRLKVFSKDVQIHNLGGWVSNEFSKYLNYKKDDIIISQYTGFKDVNDKEIYEDDIVRTYIRHWAYGKVPSIEYTGVIVFKDGKYSIDNLLFDLQDFDIEIIGNIYENPGLLTGLCYEK